MPGEKTQTWGYNANFLGKTIIFHRGQKNHITLKNDLPELTTFHWHGTDVSGPYVDGGCHAPVYPGEIKHINFTLNQPAATLWLHAHPFHIHGTRFLVLTRNGKDPYPNENGFKDTIGVNPGETVRILVKFDLPGIYMYHCHILEHEDGGMMAQIEIVDPKKPHQKYQLMDMNTLMNALAEERGIDLSNLWMAGMESYEKMGMKM